MSFLLWEGIMAIMSMQKRLEKGLLVGLFVHELSLRNKSKRNRGTSQRFKDYVVDKQTSGCCPGCNDYVTENDGAVVCYTCDAYWHFSCASVTEDEVKQLGNDEFYCKKQLLPNIE